MIYIHLIVNIYSLITFNYLIIHIFIKILYLVYFNTLLFLCDFLIIGVGESSSAFGTLGGLPRDFGLFALIFVEIAFSTGTSGIDIHYYKSISYSLKLTSHFVRFIK